MFAMPRFGAKLFAAVSLSMLAIGTDAHPAANTATRTAPRLNDRFNIVVSHCLDVVLTADFDTP
jgi:hypothetical protein